MALYALDPFLKELYQRHEEIELQLVHERLSRVICEGVVSGKIDFGLVINPIRHTELVIVELARDEVTFWRNSRSLPNVLLCNPDLLQTQSLLKKAKGINFKRTISSDSLEVLASLAKSNAGTAILPERIVKIIAPMFTKVEGASSFQDRLALVYRSDLRKTAGAKV
ncbi:MAG: LysR family transcriptional regulator substrate-binding protein, partial [Bdellovibrio sp.]|nr:LysR family transcriptional regulator substrate-binding protein [Bdellovibrio sp.]